MNIRQWALAISECQLQTTNKTYINLLVIRFTQGHSGTVSSFALIDLSKTQTMDPWIYGPDSV